MADPRRTAPGEGSGTIFKVSPQGAFTVLHSFGDGSVANDGSSPAPTLIKGPDGNFYGATFGGGSASDGTLFKITPQGKVTILHSFGDGSVANDGLAPRGILLASDGTFYGTAHDGGSAAQGVVFKFTLGYPQLTSAAVATGTATLPFTYQTTTSTPTTEFTATNLPNGLSINQQTGLISGTPTTVGTKTATLTLTGAAGVNTAQVTFTIITLPVPSVTSILYAFGALNTNLTYTITATNNATSYSATGLTGTGLSISSTTGAITGKPTAVGHHLRGDHGDQRVGPPASR